MARTKVVSDRSREKRARLHSEAGMTDSICSHRPSDKAVWRATKVIHSTVRSGRQQSRKSCAREKEWCSWTAQPGHAVYCTLYI
jgi:hypothetical protein